jgi:hypothetical protein
MSDIEQIFKNYKTIDNIAISAWVRSHLKGLESDDDRMKFLTSLGVCLFCGSTYLPCHCTRCD